MNQHVKTWVGTVIIIIMAVTIGAFVYVYEKDRPIQDVSIPRNFSKKEKKEVVYCTQEAKQCADGTFVSRTGPNCEFADCPTISDQGWKLISGDPKDTCTKPTFAGEATVRGWLTWDYAYVEKEWILNILPEDAKKLPLYEELSHDYKDINKKLAIRGVSKELSDKLKKADEKNPAILILSSYELYCEGLPVVKVKDVKNSEAGCAKEGESVGAVYPGVVAKKCCDGLEPIIPERMVGTQGICQKSIK